MHGGREGQVPASPRAAGRPGGRGAGGRVLSANEKDLGLPNCRYPKPGMMWRWPNAILLNLLLSFESLLTSFRQSRSEMQRRSPSGSVNKQPSGETPMRIVSSGVDAAAYFSFVYHSSREPCPIKDSFRRRSRVLLGWQDQ